MSEPASTNSRSDLTLHGVHLAGQSPNHLFDVTITNNAVQSIKAQPSASEVTSAYPLLLPALCHPHIHLDKAFLLTSNSSRYSDLLPTTGTFQEALANTSKAKSRYESADLELRGAQLIAESVQAGVTSMRAFVEIDQAVGTKCLDAAIVLKKGFARDCFVQLCVFAQDPVFSGEHGEYNRELMERVLDEYRTEIDALGSTPYVESTHEDAVRNISWAVENALSHNLHLDFHLDYNLDPKQQATVWDVVRILREHEWARNSDKTIALGHCTRLTLFSDDEMARLANEIRDAELPISFIGLPTSDLYMMGRPAEGSSGWQKPRGTLQIPTLLSSPYSLPCALSINNLGNAFTPYFPLDPLLLASVCVGIYHAGTTADANLLYECVSTRARKAIGLDSSTGSALELKEGGPFRSGEWILYENDDTEMQMEGSGTRVKRRVRRTVQDVVWDPPGVGRRRVVRIG